MSDSKYKRWMVGLDFSSIDEKVIKRVNHLSTLMVPDAIHFIHVEEELDIPVYIPKEYKDMVPSPVEQYGEKLKELVDSYFENKDIDVHLEVVAGKPYDVLVERANTDDIDFLIAGRKKENEGSGLLPHKLLRRLGCPALFIPDMKMPGTNRILVSIDFSEHSFAALQTAIKLAGSRDITIDCLHIYSVPIGYHSTGKTYDEFAEIMRVNAQKEFERFTKSLDADLNLKCVLLDKSSAAELIYDETKNGNYDLVMLGSKGQSSGSVMILGSTAEKFIRMNQRCMTWVVKKKGEQIGFFKALSKL